MKYLYYTLWQLFKLIKTNDMPATNAMIFISLCQMMNLATVQILISHFFSLDLVFSSNSITFLFSALIGTILLVVNYFILYKKKGLLDKKYKNDTRRQKANRIIILSFYTLGSFFLVFYLGPKWF